MRALWRAINELRGRPIDVATSTDVIVGSDGNPRVLPIRGRGATLETLAHKCAPQMTLEEVLALHLQAR